MSVEEAEKAKKDWRWFHLNFYPTEQRPLLLGEHVYRDRRNRYKKMFGTDDYYDETNQHVRKYEEEYVKTISNDDVEDLCQKVDGMDLD